MTKWFENCYSTDNVTISSRIRLARNIKNYPFPNIMTKSQINDLNEFIIAAIKSDESVAFKEFNLIELNSLKEIEILSLIERKIISPEFLLEKENKIIFLSNDENISIMIGGEDHIRISAIESGSDFETLYKKIDEVDNALSEILPIAFDEVLGYLTECPTELGTGMKASVLLHLPALKIQDEISSISDSVSKIGLAITPFDSGENTSSIYQISNNVTMGISEKTAIENLRAVTSQIVARENNARYSLDRITLEESINIALNGLKNSDKLDFDSAIDLLSKVKLGIDLGIIEGISHHLPFMLMINTKPNTLKLSLKDVKKDINIIRAEYIKRYLN